MRVRNRRLAAALASIATLVMLAPASAEAITVSGSAAPTSLQAGAHSDFKVHIAFGGAGESVKDLTIGLPPGEVGNPNATPFCSVAQLNADSCPSDTKVGEASTMVNLLGVLPNPLPVAGNIYNLEPHPGEPARFGIALHALPLPAPLNTLILPPVILQSGVQVRQTDYGLDTVVKDIPNSATLISLGGADVPVPISIGQMDLTLFGIAPETGKPFLRNPTSCAPLHATFTAVAYPGLLGGGDSATADAPPFTLTGCGGLPFSPTFTVHMGAKGQNKVLGKPPVTSVIEQAPGEAGLREAAVQLPPELGVDFVQINEICSAADFNAVACPPNTVIGSAVATSPLLTQPLTGPVVLVQSLVLPDAGLNLGGPLQLNLRGALDISGRITFSGLPDIPISHFELRFLGGPDGLNVAQRNLCVPPRPLFHEHFTSWSGATTALDTRAIVDGCGGVKAACKKHKKKRKHNRAAEAKKKHKKCKKKRKKKRS